MAVFLIRSQIGESYAYRCCRNFAYCFNCKPRYCFIVLLLCFAELTVTVLLSMILELNVTEVVAEVFLLLLRSGSNNLFMILAILFVIWIGPTEEGAVAGYQSIAAFKRPLPVLMIKTAFLE